MKSIIFVPIQDYFKSRKGLFKKFIIPTIIAAVSLLGALIFNIGNAEKVVSFFTEFLDTQISIVAILISFSVAIITILVSADNTNIQKLRETSADAAYYKPINNSQLSLFQVLLSNIAYNTIVEIIYLMGLIGILIIKSLLPLGALKYVTTVCIFFIVHILLVLLESVAQMYLTFWSKK